MGLSKAKGCSDAVLLILCIIPIYFLVWGFTGMMPWTDNPYNSYTLQALSWLNGRLDLGRDYSHLEIAYYGGKYFVSFPPFPSYVMLPFAIFCGADTPDHFIALAVSLLGAVYALRLLHEFDVKGTPAVFWALFLTVGTNLLFISVNGWVWFIAQNMSYTLCMMCLYYAKRGSGGIALTLWAAAVGCRPFQALYLPVVLYLLYENSRGTNFFAFFERALDVVHRTGGAGGQLYVAQLYAVWVGVGIRAQLPAGIFRGGKRAVRLELCPGKHASPL